MHAIDLIRQKRDGGTLDRAAIDAFIAGVTDGTLPDYQTSALLMAILMRGMNPEETAHLTDAMVRSGVRVSYPGLDGTLVESGDDIVVETADGQRLTLTRSVAETVSVVADP